MSFKPNLSVKECLDFLATRLDPIIGQRLAPHLGDHPWTVVLEILDEKRGFSSAYKYWTYDLQPQLRVLTEKLGTLGYPFDDTQRIASTIGNELRIVRKQMAHMHDFSEEEAFRANDFCVRLLEYFGDTDGLAEAKRIRHEALAAFAAKEGITEHVAAALPSMAAGPVGGTSDERDESGTASAQEEAEFVGPSHDVLQGHSSLIGDQRLKFEPWAVVQVGVVDILDDLPKRAAKEKVRAVAVEITSYEGPIHFDRLVQMTAQSFGLRRVRASREKKIAYQIRQSGLFVDADHFAWPAEINPGAWEEFRPNDSTADRAFTQISPAEIANAARFIRSKWPRLSDDDFDAAVLQTFGRRRRTKQIMAHLALAKAVLARRG